MIAVERIEKLMGQVELMSTQIVKVASEGLEPSSKTPLYTPAAACEVIRYLANEMKNMASEIRMAGGNVGMVEASISKIEKVVRIFASPVMLSDQLPAPAKDQQAPAEATPAPAPLQAPRRKSAPRPKKTRISREDALDVILSNLIADMPMFLQYTAPHSRALQAVNHIFSPSALRKSLIELLDLDEIMNPGPALEKMKRFWTAVDQHLPEWEMVRKGEMKAIDMRTNFYHTSSLFVAAVSKAGKFLYLNNPEGDLHKLAGLRNIDWSRSNLEQWGGRYAPVIGTGNYRAESVTLISNLIKLAMGLELTDEEEAAEDQLIATVGDDV